MSASTIKIGWIGAGRMGAQLVTRLLDAGYDVTVYNRTAAKAAALADKGAKVVTQPVDLADRDLVFAMVSSSKDLEQVMLGDGGLLTGLPVTPGDRRFVDRLGRGQRTDPGGGQLPRLRLPGDPGQRQPESHCRR